MTPIPILFQDEYFIVAYKESGLQTQASLDKSRPHFYGLLQRQLKENAGHDYLGLHHRLDRGTSGLLILAKQKNANEPLAALFREHRIQKTYICLTHFRKDCPEQWQVKNFLAEYRDAKAKKMRMQSVHAGGQTAVTLFQKLESFKKALLIQAQPQTGRMHQIRVHLYEQNLGIYGDDLYKGPQSHLAPRLMLHAHTLEFIHPFTQEKLKIQAPIPEDMQSFIDKMKL